MQTIEKIKALAKERSSSLRKKSTSMDQTSESKSADDTGTTMDPDATDNTTKKGLSHAGDTEAKAKDQVDTDLNLKDLSISDASPAGKKSSTGQSVAGQKTSQKLTSNPKESQPSPAPETSDGTSPDHKARLPPGFNPENTVDTQVHKTVAAAVTHEKIRPQIHEIVQEHITRDIQVDHYYHYVQPVKVVEVAAAKHFRLDPETGEKVAIEAPEGFVMPEHLRERKAADTSGLQWERRDYVVDEANPKGRPYTEAEMDEERKKSHLIGSVGESESSGPTKKSSEETEK